MPFIVQLVAEEVVVGAGVESLLQEKSVTTKMKLIKNRDILFIF